MMFLFASSFVFSQEKETRKSPHETVTGQNMKITYGRPYKKGRDIFGGLEAYGKVWRAGADEATEITISKDCTFGGKSLKAGTYTLFATPEKTTWTIILNSKLGQWGAFEYEKWKEKDVLKTVVPVVNPHKVVEQFTITPKDGGISMEWDRTSVFIPVKF